MTIFYLKKEYPKPNFGIAVGKKIGNAVIRNKMKRIFRNIIDNNRLLFKKFHNYIIIIRKEATTAPYNILEKEMNNLLRKDQHEK